MAEQAASDEPSRAILTQPLSGTVFMSDAKWNCSKPRRVVALSDRILYPLIKSRCLSECETDLSEQQGIESLLAEERQMNQKRR